MNLETSSGIGNARRSEKLNGKKVYLFDRIGCPTSRVNANKYAEFVTSHGAEATPDIKSADIVLIDTCAYDAKAETESIDNIKYQKTKTKDSAKVIVVGCLAGINPQKLQENFKGEFFSPKNEKALATILELDEEEEKFLTPFEARGRFVGPANVRTDRFTRRMIFSIAEFFHRINDAAGVDWLPVAKEFVRAHQHANSKAYAVAISQGCLGKCTFCVIPMAKGATRSLSAGLIVEKVREAVASGAKRIILTSEDTGAYGQDTKGSVIDLLKRLHQIPGDFTIHISFFDPRWLPKYGAELKEIIRLGKIKYLQLPLQSGSDSVLNRMKRAYSMKMVMPHIRELKKEFPKLTLGGQFIAGFPGETEADFIETRKVVQEGLFGYIDIFSFSNRPGAETNSMSDHLDQQLVDRRASRLRRDWLLTLLGWRSLAK